MSTYYTRRAPSRHIAALVAVTLFIALIAALCVAFYYETRVPMSTADCPAGHEYVESSLFVEPGCYPLPVADVVRDGVVGNG